jgi:hypothetical protein
MAHAIVTQSAQVASHEVSAGLTVLLDLSNGLYYSLDLVGSRVWDLIGEHPCTIKAIALAVADEYGVTAAQCHTDLIAFVGDLVAAGLATISGGELDG